MSPGDVIAGLLPPAVYAFVILIGGYAAYKFFFR